MSKEKSKSKSGAKAESKSKETIKVVANPRLVKAILAADEAAMQHKSCLITIATIATEEQLTRAEVIASIMEARGVEKVTAESQYSRIQKLLSDPKVLEGLRSGEIDLKTARMMTKKAQKNPSPEKKKENIQKKLTNAVKALIEAAKEGGMDKTSVLTLIKSACKKNGIV